MTADSYFLQTPRLRLRRFTPDDDTLLHRLDSDPAVMRYINGGVATSMHTIREQHLPRILSFYRRYQNLGFWIAERRAGGEFVGWFHMRPFEDDESQAELGYRLLRIHWGRGYATEVCRALIARAFELPGVRSVCAIAMPGNQASINVMSKCGLDYECEYMHATGIRVVKYTLPGTTRS